MVKIWDSEQAMRDRTVLVVVEIAQGSRNKYEYDESIGRFRLDRMLFASVHYPVDYGYIPDSKAEDGDPLDVMVIVGEPTFPGCAIEARPVGLLKMRDEKMPDNKILCVPATDPQWDRFRDIEDVPSYVTREIEHFFSIYKELECKQVWTGGWGNVAEAWREIDESVQRAGQLETSLGQAG